MTSHGVWSALSIAVGLAACSNNTPRGPTSCPGNSEDVWVSDSRMCVYTYAADVGAARQMAFAPNGDLFVNNGKVTVVFDADRDGTSSDSERSTFASAPGLNHGLAFSRDGKFVYASSSTTVYRWPYTMGARQAAGSPQVVVSNIPDGGHVTRTLVFDSLSRLYVALGSATNVDDLQLIQTRAQIRRYSLPANLPVTGVDFATGEVVASGMRNEVGLFMDAKDRIWSVENGRDMLANPTDIHNDNPAEEVNLIDGVGASYYGYPQCFTEFHMTNGLGAGTQWADTSIAAADVKTDAWCRDATQVHPPAFALPAHWAPLGVLEYQGSLLPFGHDLIVSSHGSWNSDTPVGRVLARLHRTGDTITSMEPIVGERGPDGNLRQGVWASRPVDVRESADGTIYFSDDMGGKIYKLTYLAH